MTLEESLDALGATPNQKLELLADADRANGWVEWARQTGGRIGLVLMKFRTGDEAPDMEGFYEDQRGKGKQGPDYGALLRMCTRLVENTGHEYRREDLEEEFDRYGQMAKVGNGAKLNDKDRERLLARADEMRVRHEDQEPERTTERAGITTDYYLRLLAEKKVTRKFLLDTVIPRLEQLELYEAKAEVEAAVSKKLPEF